MLTALDEGPGAPGLYAHVPFCAAKCGYCDFVSAPFCSGQSGQDELAQAYVAALLTSADRLAAEEGLAGFDTVFVGGGTPSVLAPRVLATLLEGLERRSGDARERSVEANPESLDLEKLDIIAAAGFTRISLGVQSLSDASLRAAGRRAGAREVRAALELLAARWKGALSVDLMGGLPFETPGILAEAVDAALAAGATHVSLYDLSLEEGTPLERAVASGAIALPDEEARAEARAAAEARMLAAGLVRYEVSNWALPGAECLHNLGYWRQGEWVGAGVAASGQRLLPGGRLRRRTGGRELGAFIADARANETVELVGPREACFEALMLALRTTRGLDLGAFAARYGREAADFARDFAALRPDALHVDDNRMKASPRGMDLLNPLLASLLEALERAWPEAEGPFPG